MNLGAIKNRAKRKWYSGNILKQRNRQTQPQIGRLHGRIKPRSEDDTEWYSDENYPNMIGVTRFWAGLKSYGLIILDRQLNWSLYDRNRKWSCAVGSFFDLVGAYQTRLRKASDMNCSWKPSAALRQKFASANVVDLLLQSMTSLTLWPQEGAH